jgi:hypothetical protein
MKEILEKLEEMMKGSLDELGGFVKKHGLLLTIGLVIFLIYKKK